MKKTKLNRQVSRLKPSADRLRQVNGWRDALPSDSSSARGYGYQWQLARREYLQANPFCRMCQARGQVTAATVVDHVRPHRGDMVLFWNRENWQPLCITCHNRHKQRQEANA